jgi:hypothetical protein
MKPSAMAIDSIFVSINKISGYFTSKNVTSLAVDKTTQI